MRIFSKIYDNIPTVNEDVKEDPIGIMIYYFADKLAHILAKLKITANQVTSFRILIAFGALYFFSRGNYDSYVFGLLCMLLNIYLDFVDGCIARLTKKTSQMGEWLEAFVGVPFSNIHSLLGFSIAYGVYKQTGNILVWEAQFLILLGYFLNMTFRDFDFHKTAGVARMKEGFQEMYDTVKRGSFIYSVYRMFDVHKYLIITFAIIFYRPLEKILNVNPLLLAVIVTCILYQINWLFRILLQLKYFLFQKKV